MRDGVCALFIAEKLGVSQPTCGAHLKVLTYRRDEERIARAKAELGGMW